MVSCQHVKFFTRPSTVAALPAPARKSDRVKGRMYVFRGKHRIWNGNNWFCEHGRRRSQCKECGGSQICEHGHRRSRCKECGGASICEHGRIRSRCKECGGASIL